MEVYPISDASPARYAVESDDEDEYHPLSPPTGSDQPPEIKVEFKSIYDIPLKRPLIFASGTAGASWAEIVSLGEQQAGIYVNNVPVGLMFYPTWTNAVVILSEAETRTRLPLFAMTTYTTAIIDHLQPTSVAILDSYLVHTYISPQAILQDNVIRYLSTGLQTVPVSEVALFAPPNLLQSTSASLLNGLFLYYMDKSLIRDGATIILLPTLKGVLPLSTIFYRNQASGDFQNIYLDSNMLGRAHKMLCAIVGVEHNELNLLGYTQPRIVPLISEDIINNAIMEVGEGSMYI